MAGLPARYGPRLEVEWLPPYAPELNPTEHVWGHTTTGDLANFIPDEVFHLGRKVAARLSSNPPSPARDAASSAPPGSQTVPPKNA
ncbi:MAG: transposase [Pirellulales bacterium]